MSAFKTANSTNKKQLYIRRKFSNLSELSLKSPRHVKLVYICDVIRCYFVMNKNLFVIFINNFQSAYDFLKSEDKNLLSIIKIVINRNLLFFFLFSKRKNSCSNFKMKGWNFKVRCEDVGDRVHFFSYETVVLRFQQWLDIFLNFKKEPINLLY